jgi:predicted nucleic acid-binding protein
MIAPVFVDTNILLYADDASDAVKRVRAQNLLRTVIGDGSCRLSIQLLQEYFSAATRKLGMDAVSVRRRVEVYSRLEVVKLDPNDVLAAIDLHDRYRVSIWDALILRAAIISDCETLYTEDLQPDFQIDKLKVVNPLISR